MILDDFVMLGTTVPEPRSDGRSFVCSAGWSPELRQLIRIYPLARRGAPHRWSVNRVSLERNPSDSRIESWKIAGDRSPEHHASINDGFSQVGTLTPPQRVGIADAATVSSIAEANARRLSLAVLHPRSTPELIFEHNPESPDSPELRLFDLDDRPRDGARRFAYIPRLQFGDDDGAHRLMLRDWGVFEFMRKYGNERRMELGRALHLTPDSLLLVGNMSHQRNAWLVISVLNGVRSAQPSLLDQAASA